MSCTITSNVTVSPSMPVSGSDVGTVTAGACLSVTFTVEVLCVPSEKNVSAPAGDTTFGVISICGAFRSALGNTPRPHT